MSFWHRRDGLAFLLTFGCALGVYWYTLPPSITLEDAGELAVAADYLGVPHPPGYPIWTFFAWLFQWILHPLEFRGYPNPARAVALMSAVFGALACGLTAMVIRRSSLLLADGLSTERSSFSRHLVAKFAGAGWGLLCCLLLQRYGSPGGFLFKSTFFAAAAVGALQALTPEDKRRAFQSNPPSLSQLGSGLYGFLLAGLCWLAAWSWLLLPSIGLVLPLALAGTLGVFGLSAAVDALVGRAARRPDPAGNLRAGGADLTLSVGGGLSLAFTPLMWSQSVIVEVYSLNAFFLSCLLLLIFWYIHRPHDRLLYLAAFLFGLGLTNHQSLLFLVFFMVAGVAAAGRRRLLKDGLFVMGLGGLLFLLVKSRQYFKLEDAEAGLYFLRLGIPVVLFLILLVFTRGGLLRSWRRLAALAALGALGLGFHLFMPLASEQNPPMNWGYARTPEGFQHALFRGQYAKFSVAENVRRIGETMDTEVEPEWMEEGREAELFRAHATRTLFLRQLGAFFFDPGWKYSIASQFSWQFPTEAPDPSGQSPPPPERTAPLALLGLLPLPCFFRFGAATRGWFLSTLVAMFFVTVVFLVIQWPELNHNDLWVKRVQYIQAHVVFAIWMAMGGGLLVLTLFALLPSRGLSGAAALALAGIFVAFPLAKDARDPRHLEHLGSSNQRHHDFGWQFGFHQLKGANGILLDELAHHANPACRIDDRAREYLRARGAAPELIEEASALIGDGVLRLDRFREAVVRKLDLDDPRARWLEQAATLSAFRALPPEEQAERLVHLHRPLPDWDYPAEMEPGAILFGGTDPGRFVPTYLIFSAMVRPDVYLLTQNALADPTYLDSMRDLYGNRIFIPDLLDSNQAFLDYANSLRLGDPAGFRALTGGASMAVSGAHEVNKINALLARQMVDKNAWNHSFYLEEAFQMPWMALHLRPHGLIFNLEPEPLVLTPADLRRDFEFWDWYLEHLLETWKPPAERSHRFRRDLQARKTYSKLRLAQAWNYFERGLETEADRAMRQSLRLYPANPEAAVRAADMYTRMRDYDRAAEVLDAFEAHDPTNRSVPAARRSLARQREINQDRLRLERALDRHLSPNTVLQLVMTYDTLEMEESMEEMAGLLLRLPGLQYEYYAQLAETMRLRGHTELYERALVKWTEREPEDARPWIDLAAVSITREAYREAFDRMTRAVQLDPDGARRRLAADPRFLDIRHWNRFRNLLGQP